MDEVNGSANGSAAVADWRPFLTDELKADPIVADWSGKASEKDVPSLLKSYAHLSKRMGGAINLPGKDAKPEEMQSLKQKLYEAGVFSAPPSDPKDYGIVKPDALPEGLGWNDDLATKFAQTLHKHGAPKGLAADLLPLYQEAILGAQTVFKTDQAAGMASLQKEFGSSFDSRKEATTRMVSEIFKDEAELQLFNQLGLGDHPKFLSVLMRLAPSFLADSSYQADAGQSGAGTGERPKEELAKIMNDKAHPMHAGYWRQPQDPKVVEHIDSLYKKAYGDIKVAGVL